MSKKPRLVKVRDCHVFCGEAFPKPFLYFFVSFFCNKCCHDRLYQRKYEISQFDFLNPIVLHQNHFKGFIISLSCKSLKI